MTGILIVAGWFFVPPLLTLGMRCAFREPVRRPVFFLQWAASGLSGAIGGSLGHDWLPAAGTGASGLLALILYWWSRRKRRRSLRALGGKARARLAAMLRNMPRPGPVLRPVPQGVRA